MNDERTFNLAQHYVIITGTGIPAGQVQVG